LGPHSWWIPQGHHHTPKEKIAGMRAGYNMSTLYQGTVGLRRKSVLDEDGPFVLALYLILIALFVVVGFAL
jgi:hypothetical protein